MLSTTTLVANTVQVKNSMHTLRGQGAQRGFIPFFHVYGMTVAMLLSVYLG